MSSPSPPGSRLAALAGAALVLSITVFSLREMLRAPAARFAVGPMTVSQRRPCDLRDGAFITGRLYGAISGDVDWHGETLECAGAGRPDGSGFRLFFSGGSVAGRPIAIVIGIDGQREAAGGEQNANITIIDEDSGRIFSTAGDDRCWAQLTAVRPLPGDERDIFAIDGLFFCAGALPSMTGGGSVTPGEFRFAGQLTGAR